MKWPNSACSDTFWRDHPAAKWPTCKRCGWDGLGEDQNPYCIPVVIYTKCERGLIYIAHNVCNECGHIWHGLSGPSVAHCPKCPSIYWTWKNYKETRPNWCSICEVEFSVI